MQEPEQRSASKSEHLSESSEVVAVEPIRSERFELVSMTLPFMRALATGDIPAAEREVGAPIPEDFRAALENFFRFRIPHLERDPSAQPWLGRVILRRHDDGSAEVIGSAGFHSAPDEEGRVEVGYRVQSEYRRQGIATEVVRALFDWAAREHGVRRFRASISPDNVPSLAIVKRLGFRQTGEQMDEIDGLELVFDLDDWPVPA